MKLSLNLNQAALILRVGLGLVFVSGGLSKLSQLLSPSLQAGMVSNYLSPNGYINQFFYDYLFINGLLSGLVTPWFFLTSLSALELLSGVLLIIGLGVRLNSLLFAFLCWSFVIALPVANVPGVELTVTTHTAPAILVMIRDIALSGLLFVQYGLGSGIWSLDEKLFGPTTVTPKANWDSWGLVLRLSLGAVFIVGGAFYGLQNIKSFAPAWILLPIGIWLIIGNGARFAAYASVLVLGWYMFDTLSLDKSLIANMNSIKREFALLASGLVLGGLGGGQAYTLLGKFQELQDFFKEAPIFNSRQTA